MTTFFYGPKWEARLRKMGVDEIPDDLSTEIPESLKEEVNLARTVWEKTDAPGTLEWETFFLPILDKWACNITEANKLIEEEDRYKFFENLLKKYKLEFDETCTEIRKQLDNILQSISDDMKTKNEKFGFEFILRGSSSDGTKIGPCDEFDYKAKLKMKPSDPLLHTFYPTFWQTLTKYKEDQDPSNDLQLLGHCLHSARLLAIVFKWKGDLLVKVDLTPTVQGGDWKGVRIADPLGEKILEQHFFILPGTDKNPPEKCAPKLKPDTSYAEQYTLSNTPQLLRDAVTLLKILINPCFTPKFCLDSPKGTDLTSYNLKDGAFWCMFLNGRENYEVPNYSIKEIVAAAVDILNNIKKREYFEVQPKEVKCHKAIRNLYKTLLLGRQNTQTGACSLLLPHEGKQKEAFLSDVSPARKKPLIAPRRKRENPLLDLTLPEFKEVGAFRVNMMRILGEGSYGKVYEAYDGVSKKKLAAKEVLLSFNEEVNRKMIQEADILSKLSSHDNIVQFKCTIRIGAYLWIFMEMCATNLDEFSAKEEISEDLKLSLMKQMGLAVHHLHTFDPPVAHRDIKPANILLVLGTSTTIKLSDFGMSKFADINASSMHTFAGTKAYMAPEVFRDHSHSIMVDIFSLAQVFYDFFAARKRNLQPLLSDGKPLGVWMIETMWKTGSFPSPPVPYDVTGSAAKKMIDSLVMAMLNAEPDKRPNIETVLTELKRIQEAVAVSNTQAETEGLTVGELHQNDDDYAHKKQESTEAVAVSNPQAEAEGLTTGKLQQDDHSAHEKQDSAEAVAVSNTQAETEGLTTGKLQQDDDTCAHSQVKPSGTEALVLVGGHPSKTQISRECYIRAGLGWQHLTTTPEELWNMAVCAVDDGFIIAGGHRKGGGVVQRSCYHYSVLTGEWRKMADMPTARTAAGCVTDGRLVWVIGGDVRQKSEWGPVDDCEVLDLSTNVWKCLPRLQQGMAYPIVCMLNRIILVLFNDNHVNKCNMAADGERTLQAFACDGDAGEGGEGWSLRCPLPHTMGMTWGARAVAHAGRMFVLGGMGRLCHSYDLGTDTWTQLTPAPRYHADGAVVVQEGRLVLGGGQELVNGEWVETDIVDTYDVTTDSWTPAQYSLPLKVSEHGLVVCTL